MPDALRRTGGAAAFIYIRDRVLPFRADRMAVRFRFEHPPTPIDAASHPLSQPRNGFSPPITSRNPFFNPASASPVKGAGCCMLKQAR